MTFLEFLHAIKDYPNDVRMVAFIWGEGIAESDLPELLAMMPAPMVFEPLNREQRLKMALWAAIDARSRYDGPHACLLDTTLARIRLAVDGAAIRAEEKLEILLPLQQVNRCTRMFIGYTGNTDALFAVEKSFLSALDPFDTSAAACAFAARTAGRSGVDGRQWMHEYLRTRMEVAK